MTKSWYESRTLWFALAQGVAGILLVVYSENPGVENIAWVAILKSLVDGYLRLTTKVQ